MGVCASNETNELPNEMPVTIVDDCADVEEVDAPTPQSLLTNLFLNLHISEEQENGNSNQIYPAHLHPPSASTAVLQVTIPMNLKLIIQLLTDSRPRIASTITLS
jgi:hypothetical protein